MRKHFFSRLRDKNGRVRLHRVIGMILAGLAIAVMFALVFAFLVQYLWNSVLTQIFPLGVISFWQAFAIIILAKVLFGGFGRHPHPHPHMHGMHAMRYNGDFFRDVNGKWDKYREFWEKEGEAAWKSYLEKTSESE